QRAPLFASTEPLEIEIAFDPAALCRDSRDAACADAPGTLLYRDALGEHRIAIAVRARGRWQRNTANCRLPALFVRFDAGTTAGTPFAGQHTLALTTHCRDNPASYQQYLLKELLAYRIYDALSDGGLGVRLAHIAYSNPSDPRRSVTRYGFFTEHFDAFAARANARVARPGDVHFAALDARELALLELFEYLIGNTDWSATFGHNVLLVETADAVVTPVPFDFDYAGLVDAPYAAPAATLPIRSVRQRLYRGFCDHTVNWDALVALFGERRALIESLVAEMPGLDAKSRATAAEYIASFYAVLASPERRAREIFEACRHPPAPPATRSEP
ncbi:MAG TPA: hypothetical protein VFO94_07830, partial [Gammaproteobacteria bacterium]|nr:hypothetical protein [Gammaproteobacteria bacterium]